MTLHLKVPLRVPLLPLRTRREVQASRLIRLTADVPRADDSMTIRHSKVEQTPGLQIGNIVLLRNLAHKLIYLGNCLHHDPAQKGLPESLRTWIRTRIHTLLLKEVEEKCKRPLAIGTSLDAQIPLVSQGVGERPLDVLESADAAVVHPHQGLVLEGVAVVIGQGALCGCAHVGEDQIGAGLRSETF